MPQIKLYDLRKKDYPDHAEFRTLQVHECSTCGSRTNKAINAGFPGTYLSPICLNLWKKWHKDLAELRAALDKVSKDYSKHILQDEINNLEFKYCDEMKDDIEGDADPSLKW